MNKITIQEGSTAQIVVYVNWKDEEILSEAEYEAELEEETHIAADNRYDFSRWLNEKYSAAEILYMSEKEREEIKIQWFKCCRECMEAELGYERREI